MIKEEFKNFLKKINDYNYKFSLYAKELPIKINDIVVLDEDLYDVKERIEDFKYIIGVEDIKDVLENLEAQLSNSTDLNICIDAINYYIEYDAFIDLEQQ